MARRKKEPGSVHRSNIASAAQELFQQKGIASASMDEIAQKAGYSKATLYVYFKNKEEIVGFLVLESMEKLYGHILKALESDGNTKTRYDNICKSLLKYQQEFPFYFQLALSEINIDFSHTDFLPEEQETFRIGEKINEKVKQFIQDGIAAGDLRRDIQIMPAIFSFWGMLSGLILTAENKKAYIAQEMELSREEFLTYGFDTLYRAIAGAPENLL
ncbi:MAG: TetR/AcrR family transcriptional regulator [Lachnospiraceae bacterium]|nr:TetR/AcrR family transcriptional regulator [Lachnospiraceae bacterium]